MDCEHRQAIWIARAWHMDRTVERAFFHEEEAHAWLKARRETSRVVQWSVGEVWLYGERARRPG